uniref:Uncharacterized protein n=1 Tax=Trypanosoma congolense (strain IL3000) TaxID=1068625 RepID=G0UQD4_TRYCI|nr:hypothetical protein, unlikely [Trypanosoma congolense IL3000]
MFCHVLESTCNFSFQCMFPPFLNGSVTPSRIFPLSLVSSVHKFVCSCVIVCRVQLGANAFYEESATKKRSNNTHCFPLSCCRCVTSPSGALPLLFAPFFSFSMSCFSLSILGLGHMHVYLCVRVPPDKLVLEKRLSMKVL